MEETHFEVTNYNLIYWLLCYLPIKIQIALFSGICPTNLSVLGGYLLQYVGIKGLFYPNLNKGGITFYPAGHTV